MTPEERAEKIVREARKMNVELGGPVLFPMIAAQIREAVEEAINKAKAAGSISPSAQYYFDRSIRAAQSGAFEEAAQIVENPPLDQIDRDTFIPTLEGIAKAIRARAKELAK